MYVLLVLLLDLVEDWRVDVGLVALGLGDCERDGIGTVALGLFEILFKIDMLGVGDVIL
jgi:hypothetical protein